MDNQQGAKIQDNPSNKKMQEQIRSMSALLRLGKLFGLVPPERIQQLKEIKEQSESLIRTVDEFNAFFSDKGWIAYELFSIPVMEKAVGLMKQGKPEEAEEAILDYYRDIDMIRRIIRRDSFIEAYRPRKQLVLYALNDYEAGRYYSCVLLLLSVIDGLVNDISKQTGFFSENSDLTSWDSIAGHHTGLMKLKAIYNRGRPKTSTEEITMPYRNGILHGRDLNYNNIYVAAKCWGCLGAVLDWGKDIAQGKKEAPPPEPVETLAESFRGLIHSTRDWQKARACRERISSWKPRQIDLVVIGLENIPSQSLAEYSPERSLVEFFEYWGRGNYGYMARFLPPDPFSKGKNSTVNRVRALFADRKLLAYQITAVQDKSLGISEVTAIVQFQYLDENPIERHITFSLAYEGKNVISGEPGGKWEYINGYYGLEHMLHSTPT